MIDFENDFWQTQVYITEDTHAWGYILKSAIVAVVPAEVGSTIVLSNGAAVQVLLPPRKVMLQLSGATEEPA